MPREQPTEEERQGGEENRPQREARRSDPTTFPSHWLMMLCATVILIAFLSMVVPLFWNAIVRIWNLM
jgi:hypothetical protein